MRSILSNVAKLRRQAKKITQWSVVFATVAVLVQVAREHSTNFGDINLDLDAKWLVIAAIATTVANLLLPLGWRSLLSSFNHDLKPSRAMRLWCLAQTGRYLPTGLVAVVSRVQLAAKEGISKAVTLTSIGIETVILLGWAVLICSIFIPSSVIPTATRWLAGIASSIGLIAGTAFAPVICRQLSKFKRLSVSEIKTRYLGDAVALLGSSVAARAVGSVCLAAAILNLDASSVSLTVGAVYAGVVVGMIGVTPAGIGVREGVMTAILASQFGLTDAAAFALLARAWEFTFEVFFLAAATWLGRNRKDLGNFIMDSSTAKGKL